jgi:hypothetical protein
MFRKIKRSGATFLHVCFLVGMVIQMFFVEISHANQKFFEDFERTPLDGLPAGWTPSSLNNRFKSNWKISQQESENKGNKSVCREGNAPFSTLLNNHFKFKNGSIEAIFKIISGKEDPEAGVFFRYLNAQNYLYVRANSLEKNVVFYRMSGGIKSSIKAADAPVVQSTWQKISVSFKENIFKVEFDNKEIMNFKFAEGESTGNVGFWTTADSNVCFDDFRANP